MASREAEVILRRMKRVLDQMPEAMRQAHERIIGERRVANADKILSLYESDIHVIVRGNPWKDFMPSRRSSLRQESLGASGPPMAGNLMRMPLSNIFD
jgi:hypothetical protein